MREQFERWAHEKGMIVGKSKEDYHYEDTRLAWRTWKAATNQALEDAARRASKLTLHTSGEIAEAIRAMKEE